jgi:hypothetical protein
MFLAAVTPHCVIGSNYSQQNLFRIDPETGAIVESEAPVSRTSGEPMCAVGFHGKGYIGIYTQSVLSVFNPERPFGFAKNPIEIACLGDQYKQTRPRDAVEDGKFVYITSDSAYNELGGALAIIHPRTRRVEVLRHLIKDQNLPSLDYDPVTKLLWGGTDRWGQMRSCPPTQESALIYAFDPETRTVVDMLKPWPGADVVRVHGVSRNGILVASCSDQIALVHTPSREVLYIGAFPAAIPSKLQRGADGKSYCLAGDLFEWNFDDNCLKVRARTEGAMFLAESSPGTWVFANETSIYRLRLGVQR